MSGVQLLGNGVQLGPISAGNIIGLGPYATAATGQLPGTSTNDNATAGNIGEIISAQVLVGSAVALTTATPANVTSISLTAGDWDVWGVAGFTGNAATTVTSLSAGLSQTSATLPTGVDLIEEGFGATAAFANANQDLNCPVQRVSLAATTTVYLVAQAAFAVNTAGAYGFIRARRVR